MLELNFIALEDAVRIKWGCGDCDAEYRRDGGFVPVYIPPLYIYYIMISIIYIYVRTHTYTYVLCIPGRNTIVKREREESELEQSNILLSLLLFFYKVFLFGVT